LYVVTDGKRSEVNARSKFDYFSICVCVRVCEIIKSSTGCYMQI
jgi:hypothetical protein